MGLCGSEKRVWTASLNYGSLSVASYMPPPLSVSMSPRQLAASSIRHSAPDRLRTRDWKTQCRKGFLATGHPCS